MGNYRGKSSSLKVLGGYGHGYWGGRNRCGERWMRTEEERCGDGDWDWEDAVGGGGDLLMRWICAPRTAPDLGASAPATGTVPPPERAKSVYSLLWGRTGAGVCPLALGTVVLRRRRGWSGAFRTIMDDGGGGRMWQRRRRGGGALGGGRTKDEDDDVEEEEGRTGAR